MRWMLLCYLEGIDQFHSYEHNVAIRRYKEVPCHMSLLLWQHHHSKLMEKQESSIGHSLPKRNPLHLISTWSQEQSKSLRPQMSSRWSYRVRNLISLTLKGRDYGGPNNDDKNKKNDMTTKPPRVVVSHQRFSSAYKSPIITTTTNEAQQTATSVRRRSQASVEVDPVE